MFPTRNNCIVVPRANERTTAGGIIIQEQMKSPLQGVVTEVGPDVKEVQVGDMVFFTEVVHRTGSGDTQVYVVDEKAIYAYTR